MGKVNFQTVIMKRLDQQLKKRFPADVFYDADETSFETFNEDKFQCLYSKIDVPDMPEEIETQEISLERYGSTLRVYLDRLKQNRDQVYIDDICAEANIQRTYLYKILKGERRPSRDLAIAFCFVFKLTVQESQDHLLMLGEQLNDYVKRDFIIMFGLRKSRDLDSINEILEHYNERPLIDLQ